MNRTVFFNAVRDSVFHGKLTQGQVDGMTHILDYYEKNYASSMSQKQFAYLLASIYHETAHTMQPIKEIGGSRMHYAPAYGRGLIQITFDRNYRAFGAIPYDTALEWPKALEIAFRGCADGVFTGKRLSDYINDRKCDYTNARRVVNGTDRAALIAGYAKSFDAALVKAAAAPVSNDIHSESVDHGSIFDGLSDFFDWTKHKKAPQQTAPQVHTQVGFIAAAIVAIVGSLQTISAQQWDMALATPTHEGLNEILFGIAIAVANLYLPHWLVNMVPRPRKSV
jgi:hypothetical protein